VLFHRVSSSGGHGSTGVPIHPQSFSQTSQTSPTVRCPTCAYILPQTFQSMLQMARPGQRPDQFTITGAEFNIPIQ
jgi:hypothetical protein